MAAMFGILKFDYYIIDMQADLSDLALLKYHMITE